MRSTGEVMCFGKTFAEAYLKSIHAVSGVPAKPTTGAFLQVDMQSTSGLIELAKELQSSNIAIYADNFTAEVLSSKRIACKILGDEKPREENRHPRGCRPGRTPRCPPLSRCRAPCCGPAGSGPGACRAGR